MKKSKTNNLAEDVMKLDLALIASLKGVRALASRLHQDSADGGERETFEKIIAKRVTIAKKAPDPPSRAPKPEPSPLMNRFGKAFALLSEGQAQTLLDLARSMAKNHRREGKQTRSKADSEKGGAKDTQGL
ncbi:MAG: hypothetical protein ABI036_11140 [Fibrobacteria bacterium]